MVPNRTRKYQIHFDHLPPLETHFKTASCPSLNGPAVVLRTRPLSLVICNVDGGTKENGREVTRWYSITVSKNPETWLISD